MIDETLRGDGSADHGYNGGMKIAIDLSTTQVEQLRERAKSLGIQPEELARAAVADLLTNPGEEFLAAAEAVLEKHHELYKRLA